MPSGSPYALKCPACRRGQYGQPRPIRGVRGTGRLEPGPAHKTKQTSGSGKGGPNMWGWKGEAECLDCGHFWWSNHPQVSARQCSDVDCEAVAERGYYCPKHTPSDRLKPPRG